MKTLKFYLIVAFSAAMLIACDNNDESIENEGTHVSAVVKFDHSLALGDEFVLTDSNDDDQTIELTKFKYLISDVIITNTDNEEFAIPNNIGAQLVDLANADASGTVKVYLTNVPNGTYKSIQFGVGVSQEVANGSTEDQTRLMHLAESDMQWTWNPNSYIFSKIEGSNVSTETTAPINLQIHVGYKGDVDGFRVINLDFPETLTVAPEVSPSAHVTVAIEKLFQPDAPGVSVAFDAVGAHGGTNEASINYADNFTSIFEIHHLHTNEEAINLEDVEEDSHDDSEEDSGHSH